jgi:hypothetical protein
MFGFKKQKHPVFTQKNQEARQTLHVHNIEYFFDNGWPPPFVNFDLFSREADVVTPGFFVVKVHIFRHSLHKSSEISGENPHFFLCVTT